MVKDRPLGEFLAALAAAAPFCLSRWGDAEWHALFGETNGFMPRDGYFYFPALRRELWAVLHARPRYGLTLATDDPRAANAISGAELDGLDWGADPFAGISGHGLDRLFRAATAKPLVIVGPPWYRHLRRHLTYAAFVDVPPKNAYLCRQHLVREVLAPADDLKEPGLVAVSAGVCGPLLIHDLHRQIGTAHQLVDFGGVWGAYL